MEIISIYPNNELKKSLEDMAKKEDRSMNNFILHILKNYIGDRKNDSYN